VLPFGFREFLRHRGTEPKQRFDQLGKAKRSAVDSELAKYLRVGGFPEAQGIDRRDRFELLRGYIDTAMLRDVIERHAVSHPVALRWMVRQLLGNAGGSFSINKFYNDLRSQGIGVAKDTLHAYLSHLEDAFVVHTVPIATESQRRRMVNPRKAYPIDAGLTPVFDRTGKANIGHALETAVAIQLVRLGAEISYVRTTDGYEVDFLARFSDGEQRLIQVCAEMTGPDVQDREIRALLAAAKEHPRATSHLIVATGTVRGLPEAITQHAATRWLLDAG
jgi:hypothetical protein